MNPHEQSPIKSDTNWAESAAAKEMRAEREERNKIAQEEAVEEMRNLAAALDNPEGIGAPNMLRLNRLMSEHGQALKPEEAETISNKISRRMNPNKNEGVGVE